MANSIFHDIGFHVKEKLSMIYYKEYQYLGKSVLYKENMKKTMINEKNIIKFDRL
mgnify:CR=1 FL=1